MTLLLLLVSACLGMIGFAMSRMLLTLYALHLGASPVEVGIVAGMLWIFPVALAWPVGILADRIGSRLLLAGGCLSVTGTLLIAWLLQSMAAIYIAALLGGFAILVGTVVTQNAVGQLSTPETRARNYANYSLTASTSSFVSPLLAGPAIDHLGFSSAALVLTVVPLCGVVLLGLFGGRLPRGHGEKRSGGSLSAMLSGPGMRSALVLSGILTLSTDLFMFYVPVYGHELGLSASQIGVASASMAISMFAARFFMARLISWLGEERLLMGSLFLASIGYLLLPFTTNTATLAIVGAGYGLSVGCGQPLTIMLAYALSVAGRSGETLGVRMALNNTMRLVGPFLCGLLASAFGLLPVFWLNAAILGGGGMISRARVSFAPGEQKREGGD